MLIRRISDQQPAENLQKTSEYRLKPAERCLIDAKTMLIWHISDQQPAENLQKRFEYLQKKRWFDAISRHWPAENLQKASKYRLKPAERCWFDVKTMLIWHIFDQQPAEMVRIPAEKTLIWRHF